MKQLAILCVTALALSLLSGCVPAMVVTSAKDEAFRKDWNESMEELERDLQEDQEEDALDRAIDGLDKAVEDWAEKWENDWKNKGKEISDRFSDEGKLHRWRVLDEEGQEQFLITDEAQVKALDDLLLDDSDDWARLSKDCGEPLYTYVYSQQETLKAGQDPDTREYEDLLTFTVSGTKDVVTMQIRGGLEELAVFGLRMEDVLTFDVSVPAETAEALRNPEQFS